MKYRPTKSFKGYNQAMLQEINVFLGNFSKRTLTRGAFTTIYICTIMYTIFTTYV